MSIIEKIISIYAPHVCAGCEAEGSVLCGVCVRELPRPLDRCYRCHAASKGGLTCDSCSIYGLVAVNAATRYVRSAKDAVWSLKFGRARAAAGCMVVLMLPACERRLRHCPARVVIVPAPTATSRARMRGYDQAAVLARALARQTGTMYFPLLLRIGHQKQVGAGRVQRRAQLRSAFEVRDLRLVRGAHIILVDDVVTTGATLEAAAQALLSAGARSVEAIVFAQA